MVDDLRGVDRQLVIPRYSTLWIFGLEDTSKVWLQICEADKNVSDIAK